MKRKAISLLSGGLDSALATKLMLEQGIDMVGLHFTSHFCSRKDKEQGLQAIKTAQELGIKLVIKDKGAEYIDLVKSPEHGYGKNMNPCIDCRIFMLKKTRDIMAEEGASFVVTGEVLGQRPMSQRRDTIQLIEKASGLEGLIVRPLSGKLFLPTIPETEGIIDRAQFLDIAGRSRAVQYSLTATYHLKEFGCPGGGCLLTDPIFSKKLRDLFFHDKVFTAKDIALLSIGRHFRLRKDTKLILGRNQGENETLKSLWSSPYILFSPIGFKGPSGILKGTIDEETIRYVVNIIGYYGKHTSSTISIESNNGSLKQYTVEREEIDIERFKI